MNYILLYSFVFYFSKLSSIFHFIGHWHFRLSNFLLLKKNLSIRTTKPLLDYSLIGVLNFRGKKWKKKDILQNMTLVRLHKYHLKYSLKNYWFSWYIILNMGFPAGSVVTNLHANAKDAGNVGSISGCRRSPGVKKWQLQYSRLDNSMDREAWQTTVPGVTKSQTWWVHMHAILNITEAYWEICLYFNLTEYLLSCVVQKLKML